MSNQLGSPASVTHDVTPKGRTRGRRGKLSDEHVRRAKPQAKPYTLSDGHGLHLIVRPTGAKVWFLSYRLRGKQAKLKLGTYPHVTLAAAREIATTHLGDVAKGDNPARNGATPGSWPRTPAPPSPPCWSCIVASISGRRRSRSDQPTRSSGPCAGISRPNGATSRSRTSAARHPHGHRQGQGASASHGAERLRLPARHAELVLEEEIINVHPMIGLKAPAKASERDRILSDDELRLVWNAEIEHPTGPAYRDILRLLILTGARRSEIGELPWQEVNPDAQQLEIVRDRMKGGAAHTVPLSDSAMSILTSQPSADHRDGQVFVSDIHWARMKKALDKQLPDTVKHWVLHDLRRTAASGLQKLGIMPEVIEQCLGHRVGGERGGSIRRVYQRYNYAKEKRAALNVWADHIELVLKGRASSVVALRR